MKRKRLAELVREEAGALEEASAPKEERAEEAPPAQASPPGERPLPPYLTYVRKECRLRPDQLDALTALARRVAEGWDRYSAPSAARTLEWGWVGSFEEPGGAYSVEASSKRESYRLARREWVRRLLG